ncbi:hypothetical protein MKX08_005952 [Trichoderma sp. CBMAI-0020]|nr:hypothetical protein MKX08_005952 [Trichoderma sp. CBMAI-0020]
MVEHQRYPAAEEELAEERVEGLLLVAELLAARAVLVLERGEEPLEHEHGTLSRMGLVRSKDKDGRVGSPVGGELSEGLGEEDEGGAVREERSLLKKRQPKKMKSERGSEGTRKNGLGGEDAVGGGDRIPLGSKLILLCLCKPSCSQFTPRASSAEMALVTPLATTLYAKQQKRKEVILGGKERQPAASAMGEWYTPSHCPDKPSFAFRASQTQAADNEVDHELSYSEEA